MGNSHSHQEAPRTAANSLCVDPSSITLTSPLLGHTEDPSCSTPTITPYHAQPYAQDDDSPTSGCCLPLGRILGRRNKLQPARLRTCHTGRSSLLSSRGGRDKYGLLARLLPAHDNEQHPDCWHAEERQPLLLPLDQQSDAPVTCGSPKPTKRQSQGKCMHALIIPDYIRATELSPSQQWSFGACRLQDGWREMDEHVVTRDLTHRTICQGIYRAVLVAVFEGQCRGTAADHLSDTMVDELLMDGPETLCQQPLQALQRCMQRLEDSVIGGWAPPSPAASGNSMCAALLLDDMLHVAHVGNSRGILARGRQALFLDTSCPPVTDVPTPSRSVSSSGSEGGRSDDLAAARDHYEAVADTLPAGARTRTLDVDASTIRLNDSDDFVVLATHKVWNSVGRSDAATAVRSCLGAAKKAAAAAKAVVSRARQLGADSHIAAVALVLHGRRMEVFRTRSAWMERVEDAASAQSAQAPQLETLSMKLNVL